MPALSRLADRRGLPELIRFLILLDIRGPKILESLSILNGSLDKDVYTGVLERYYELVEKGVEAACVSTEIRGESVHIYRLSSEIVLVGFSETDEDRDHDLRTMASLGEELALTLNGPSPKALKRAFTVTADKLIRTTVRVCFVMSKESLPDDRSGGAVRKLAQEKQSKRDGFTRRLAMGPFAIEAMDCTPEEVAAGILSMQIPKIGVFVFVVSSPLLADVTQTAIEHIRKLSDAPILVVPASDDRLELAREFESDYGVELCDSVSDIPSELLLSVLASAGFTDMQPEQARRAWVIDSAIDVQVPVAAHPTDAIGHQAFFVVDRGSGETTFTYYYEAQSSIFSRMPNVVAAICTFRLEADEPGKTSVFTAGDMSFVMIEKGELIFTLVTGQKDVEGLRKQFSFLPDLYFDEMPTLVESTDDPYSAPPFTLKLLATIPPEEIPRKMVPYRVREPAWGRFKSEQVVDFLRAVWDIIDGKIEMSRLVQGPGPHMTVGAIHFLKNLGAIDLKLVVHGSDAPRKVAEPTAEVVGIYSNIEEILALADGMLTVEELASLTGVDVSVLLRVFGDLYRRGIVDFE